MQKLWLYNLHYFDYALQENVNPVDVLNLMNSWIDQNPPTQGNGWEPYPIALRIVNWVKFLAKSDRETDLTKINHSLYLQCRFLARHLEYHLLGNHLFKNGVALLFAGTYFQGKEAADWLKTGVNIIAEQIGEQVLADGGHFERSPMYHVLILEDILDCLNLHQAAPCFSDRQLELIKTRAQRMLTFLVDTAHQDGEIAFFNDSALKIAPATQAILDYAVRLGLAWQTASSSADHFAPAAIMEKPEFGLYVLQNKSSKMIVDAGAIGPDYLPGHAHCDTLSYELSIAGQRCIVNSGTYQYAGEQRNDFRATAAHNTVRIDAQEQHEIWSTFRVARRGYPFDINVRQQDRSISLSAAHSGYKRLPGQPVHRREIICHPDSWIVNDHIESSATHLVESYIHLHPDVQILSRSASEVLCVIAGKQFTISALTDQEFEFENGVYSPEFGLKLPNKVLVLRKSGACPLLISYKIASA